MHWTKKELEAGDSTKLVRFLNGRLYSILPDRTKKTLTYTLGDEFGMIEGKPQHQGPLSEAHLLIILNQEGANPVTLGDAMQMRASHRVFAKQKAANVSG